MIVELVKDKAHAIHQRVHVVRFSILVASSPALSTVLYECSLEGFKVVHPFNSEVVRLDIGLIEDEDEGKLGLV